MNKCHSLILILFVLTSIACIGMIAYLAASNTNSNKLNKVPECQTKACLNYGNVFPLTKDLSWTRALESESF